jgi:hypothetical protein
VTAALAATVSLVLIAAGFRFSHPQQVVEAERITLRSSPGTRAPFGNSSVELSVGLDGGLDVQFTADTAPNGAPRRRPGPSPELRLVDATGHEVARLGSMKASQLAK